MSTLRQLANLNKYEESAYLTLVKIGISTSSKISKEASVPYGKIYPTLFSLENKGLIKTYSGQPKKFIAIEPEIIFDKLLEKKEKELKEDREELKGLLKKIESNRKSKPTEPKEAVHVIEGEKNYLNLSLRLHNNSKKSWFSIQRFPVYKPHLEAYKKMIERGVDTRIISPIEMKNTEKHEIWKKVGAKIRFSADVITRYSIIDEADVVLRIKDLTERSFTAIWIKSPSLAKTLTSNFESLWKTSIS